VDHGWKWQLLEKLHVEEIPSLHSSPNIDEIEEEMSRACGKYGTNEK
jgi:hypothetical protein